MSARQGLTGQSIATPGAAGDCVLRDLLECRRYSEHLAEPLSDEDQTVQACDDASPTKWHLAHTTWFFETFLLQPHLDGYQVLSGEFAYCFNSYYETLGSRQPRAKRGVLTRPSASEVRAYRAHVDHALAILLQERGSKPAELRELIALGVNHEQQHQELLLTDILCLFAQNPIRPAYRPLAGVESCTFLEKVGTDRFVHFDGGLVSIGHEGPAFAYDNESPRHQVFLRPFKLASRLVTNEDWLQFMADGAYSNPLLWLADGWAIAQQEGWSAPGYWEQVDGAWHQMSLEGLRPVDPSTPVCHASYYEADAFARWSGKRLPSEAEWETAATIASNGKPDLPSLRPSPPRRTCDVLQQMFGTVWQWTASAYLPYPGYRSPAGAVGEYNGKFMCNQHVLRGSSCFTPVGHSRATYRNFFYPHQRWQITGLRLAEDA